MTLQARRSRDREEREQLIVAAARELAEAEGWDAVTTRKLAEHVEYSQPVLYSHFKNKDAIVAAVAVRGFLELAAELCVRRGEAGAEHALGAVSTAYVDFANRHPALYDAMFGQSVDLPFARDEAPAPLHAAFGELVEAIRPYAGTDNVGPLTEIYWASLHGLVTLTRGGRLPPDSHERRLAMLLARFTGSPQ